MPAYSFRERFEADVTSGRKRHTIRGKRRNRPSAGQTFHGYVAMRTKKCRKIIEAPIQRVEDIQIEVDVDAMRIWVEGVQLTADEREQLAVRDGFASADEMHRFWRYHHGLGHFDGDLIHWDYDLRKQALPAGKVAA